MCTALAYYARLQVIGPKDKVAVLGDGKLGLLVAQALVVLKEVQQLTHFGRHQEKLKLVAGTKQVVVNDATEKENSQVSLFADEPISISFEQTVYQKENLNLNT